MSTRRTLIVALTSCVIAAGTASAQIIRPGAPSANPMAYASLSLGWMRQAGICDAVSDACWNFDGAPQWRATLEMPVGRGGAFGVAGSLARVGLDYSGGLTSGCGSCRANANISQLMANFRMGGGELGFHQVIDISAGATLFSNFRSTSGTQLGSGKATTDFSFALGYGFGYGLSRRAEIMVLQDYGLVIHRKNMPGSDNSAQQATIRIGARYGLGDKGRGY